MIISARVDILDPNGARLGAVGLPELGSVTVSSTKQELTFEFGEV